MANFLILNGPNLNLLGSRETQHYGHISLASLNEQLQKIADRLNHRLTAYQSNAEHELIERIHTSPSAHIDVIIFNPAAFTHTSIALRDALIGIRMPFIEVHLSNLYQRESFRQTSYFSDIASGLISGFGAYGYEMALYAADHLVTTEKTLIAKGKSC